MSGNVAPLHARIVSRVRLLVRCCHYSEAQAVKSAARIFQQSETQIRQVITKADAERERMLENVGRRSPS